MIHRRSNTVLVDLVQTTTSDGIRLDGIFQAPESPGKAGLAVDAFCFVHGTGSNFYGSTLFDALGSRLLELGCAVLRVNTRGHDLMSTAATPRGGRRLGAAYEVVDDCRHDLSAWIDWLRQRAGPRVGLVGHSLGAVKCLYALAKEPHLDVACVAALSPPRLSHSWFRDSPESKPFLDTYTLAECHVLEGQSTALLDVKVPIPFVIAAGGFVEKYGPDERYNFLHFLPDVGCPTLITLGSAEVASNVAFRALPEALNSLAIPPGRLLVQVISGADHFYTGLRAELAGCIETWLRSAFRSA
jgi:dienelactone hydrolase